MTTINFFARPSPRPRTRRTPASADERRLFAVWHLLLLVVFAALLLSVQPAAAMTQQNGVALTETDWARYRPVARLLGTAAALPPGFFTVVDQGGANDVNSAQVDLTQFGRDDSNSSTYRLFWSWDAIDQWGGTGQTGDACALFDTNGNGKIDYVVCGQIQNQLDPKDLSVVLQTSGSPFAFTCGDDKSDRCSNPSPADRDGIVAGVLGTGTPGASPPGNLVTATDPFPNLSPDQDWPNDSTLEIVIPKTALPAGAALVNVCSYPSAGNGGNNNPFDCIVNPGGGFLKIDKAAGTDSSTQFAFTVNPGSLAKSVTGTGSTGGFSVPIGTSYAVAETAVSGWDLTGAACTLENGTSTGAKSGSTVSGVEVQSGKITTCTFTNVKQLNALSLVKTATPATYSKVGDVISYSYLVTNSGNLTLSGPVTVSDDKATATCPATSSLAPGASITCTASHAITQADLDSGSLTNTATASAGGITSNPDSETVNATQTRTLTLVKTATPVTYSSAGQTIGYSYLVSNNGNVRLAGPVTVSDDKATATCPATSTVGNNDGYLDPGESLTCAASYTTTQADLDSGSVTNTATASAGGTTSSPDSETVTAAQRPALTLVKTASPATYSDVGDVIAYSYLVTNSGNVTLSGPVTVSDDKATATCPATSSLAPGASVTCTASHTIVQAELDSGTVTNTATASAGGTTSNPDSETVTADQRPALALVKTATPATYTKLGDVISYSYLVTNTGNVTLSGPFTVSDDKATATCPSTSSLARGASITCTASHTITQADLDRGSLTNTATAHAGGVASDPDSETVTAVRGPTLTLTKTASPTTYSKAGDVISYGYVLTNAGNVTLSGPFTVSDDKATATCPATSSLAPAASITCTASHTITQADVNAGSVKNTAKGHASYNEQDVFSNEDSRTVTYQRTVVLTPALALVKSATPATYTKAGDVISYGYVLTNTGNVTLTGPFTVHDDKTTVSCPATSSLASGASLTCTASYAITQADLVNGKVKNTAKAHASYNGGDVYSNEASKIVSSTPVDLSITKVDSPDPVAVGGRLVYTIVVTNKGLSGTAFSAGDVTVADPLPAGVAFVSVTSSRGTCTIDATGLQCKLGALAAGDSVTITLVARAETVGTVTNTAVVLSTEPDVNTADNTATAVTSVRGAFVPPATCARVIVKPMTLNVGKRTLVLVLVRDQRNKPLAKASVRLRGPGIDVRGKTNAKGRYTRSLSPKSPGIVQVRVPGPAACVGRLGVVGVFQPPVTG